MKHDLTFLRPLVATVLRDDARDWTVQGFGFLRTYFGPPDAPKRYRLNLWHSRFTVPGVSTIHDHPWDFKSVIVAGAFQNIRYRMRTENIAPTHTYATIKTGINSGLQKDNPKECRLYRTSEEHYVPGDTYRQAADEIHETTFVDGAVTLNERVGDTEHARVFWPYGQEWVDAKPRRATPDEVNLAVSQAVRHF